MVEDCLRYPMVIDLRRCSESGLVSVRHWLLCHVLDWTWNRAISSIGSSGVRVCGFQGFSSVLVSVCGEGALVFLRGRFILPRLWSCLTAGTTGMFALTSVAAIAQWLRVDHHFGAGTRLSVQGIGHCRHHTRLVAHVLRQVVRV